MKINNICRIITSEPQMSRCIGISQMCNNHKDCPLDDDEDAHLCTRVISVDEFCALHLRMSSTALSVICELDDTYKRLMWNVIDNHAPHFSLVNISIRPPEPDDGSSVLQKARKESAAEGTKLVIRSRRQPNTVSFHCGGGILVNILGSGLASSWNGNEKRCLCPPAFYGNQCEYQNQRVTVTLRVGTFDGLTSFSFVVYLLDDKSHIIESFHQINYVSIRDCQTKFSLHLLYSSRPKAFHRNYSVKIDAFETKTLYYRTSWIFPLVHSFLPVYRLSISLTMPLEPPVPETSCPLKCSSAHGYCTIYANTGQFFCKCKPGRSGSLCTDSYKCDCSPHSLCVGLWNNRSICVCPLHKFGPRCYLTSSVCEQKTIKKCQNGGQCIPSDVRIASDPVDVCLCPIEFHGKNCEYNQSRIDISLTSLSTQNIPEYFFLHFITVRSHPSANREVLPTKEWGPHERTSTFKKIPFDRSSITVYWSNEFHLLFAQDQINMYLLILQIKHLSNTNYKVTVKPSQRCPPIRELLNSTIISFPLLRRVKCYHIPCQKRVELSCFHDEDQFICLCTHDRRANCFLFDHHMKYHCSHRSHCENGGQCFQNNITCPSAAVCACPTCYLGARCHLSTKGFGLPLDVILSYQIRPHVAFTNQPVILRVSVGITLLILLIGLINGILCIFTFRRKAPRVMGCGVYLYVVSIISLLTTITFTLKFILLVLTQLLIITNRIVLIGQCFSIDFLLKGFLQTGDWLYACVAVDRLFSVIKGINFNKTSSKKAAKWVIGIVLIFVSGTSVHEVYYRTLIDDVEEQRIWCIVRYPKSYSSWLTTYTTIISIVHFMGPFTINIVSTVGVIVIAARHRSHAEKNRSYCQHLNIQIRQHKYLIISPIALILLAVPRIILAFTLECMKSARDPVTLLLIGYFVSFIPPILTFVVFVLPSKTYTKAFKAAMLSIRKIVKS